MAKCPTKLEGKSELPKFTELNDLVCEQVGGKILFATDDWFAAAENLLVVPPAVFKPQDFTEFGKWMDGWETRRRRVPGHDWCILQLGAPGIIHGLEIDTSFFTGNYAPRVSVQAACVQTEHEARKGDKMGTKASEEEFAKIASLKSEDWPVLLPMREMGAGYKDSCHNYFVVDSPERWTHVRLNIYPDGGIARFRAYGIVSPDWSKHPPNELTDLAAMMNGGICTGYSNAHYGHARNLITPGQAAVMAEGWETARRLDRPPILKADKDGILQVPGNEWAQFKLGHPGVIEKIEIDTNHFKGNFPDSCYIEGCLSTDTSSHTPDGEWKTLLPAQKLSADTEHYYSQGQGQIKDIGVVSHVRITMAPDGGISRMRLWGRPHIK